MKINLSKDHAKSFLGKNVIRNENEKGKIIGIGFHNSNWSICWYTFQSERGGQFLVPISEIKIQESQLKLF